MIVDRRLFVRLGLIGIAGALGPSAFAAAKKAPDTEGADKTGSSKKAADAAPSHHWAQGEMVLGKPDAPVTIIEYASMTCTHCARFALEVFPKVEEQYIEPSKVKWVFREFPLDALAVRAAMLARCAGKDRYFGVVQLLFQQQEKWALASDPTAALQRIGAIAGIPKEEFEACMADKALMDQVVASRLQAEQKFKIESTPSFIIDGKVQSGELSFDKFQQLVDPLLARS